MKSKSLGCNASYSVIQVLLLALQQRSEHIKKALDRVSPYALSRFMTLDFNGFKVEEQSKERALLPRLECEVSKIASVHLARPVGGCFFICSLSRMHWAELCRKTTPYSSKTLKKANLALILAKTRSEQFFSQRKSSQIDKYSNEYSIFWDTGTQLQISFGSRIWFLPITGDVFLHWSAILRSLTSKNFIQKFYPNLRKLNLKSGWQIYQSCHTQTHSHEWITPFKIIQAQVKLFFLSGTCQLSSLT